jgi:hypothetical protein
MVNLSTTFFNLVIKTRKGQKFFRENISGPPKTNTDKYKSNISYEFHLQTPPKITKMMNKLILALLVFGCAVAYAQPAQEKCKVCNSPLYPKN